MGDFAVEGIELKKMIKLAKKGPIPFGFNPGKSEEEAYCGMHRTKPAAQIGKEAKESGDGGKYAFGTATVEGKDISLTCEREMPGLAKRFKKFLKSQKLMMNVIILDIDGNVLESDVEEDLPDDADLNDDDDTQAADDSGPDEPTGEEPPPDPAAVVRRLAMLADQIKGLPPANGSRLSGPFKQLVDLAKAGDIARAAAGADKLEEAIRMMGQQVPDAPPAPPVADAQIHKLQQAASTLRARADTLTDDKERGQLLAALDKTGAHIAESEVEAAIGLLKRIGEAMKGLAVAGSNQAPGQDAGSGAAKEAWQTRFNALEGQINTALTQGLVSDVDALRKLRDWSTGMALEGSFDKASQALPRIEAILATMGTGPRDTGDMVRKRRFLMIRWQQIPVELKAEVDGLIAAIAMSLPYEDPGELQGAIDGELTGLIDRMQILLNDAVDTAINAGDNGYAPVKSVIGKLRGQVAASELIQALKDNPMHAGGPFEGAFIAALDEIETAITG